MMTAASGKPQNTPRAGPRAAGQAPGPGRARVSGIGYRQRVTHWYNASTDNRLVRRLLAVDVINRGMLFAAILLLCLVPFLIILQALVGRSAATGIIRRFGLGHDAADAVGHVLTTPTATSSAITGLSWAFFLLGGIAAAAAIQELYEHVFDVQGRGMRDMPRRVLWLGVLVGAIAVADWTQPWLHTVGGPVLVGTVGLVSATAFWWFTMWLLLAGRRSWRELFPCALATGVCWLGMDIVFRITMSDTITANYEKYGAIGVVFALMSFLIAVGVVITLGAVFGLVWRERDDEARSS